MVAKYTQMNFEWSKMRTKDLDAGCLRAKDAVREALKQALDVALVNYGMDREAVSKELSRLVGEDVSIHTINNWCAEGKSNRRFPLEYARAIALISGEVRIIRAALAPEFDVMDEVGRTIYAYGEMVLEDKVRGKKKRKLEERALRINLNR